MARTWFLVANASKARICEWADGHRHLLEVADFITPQSRSMESSFDCGHAGHVRRLLGEGDLGGADLTLHTDPRYKEHGVFARELAVYVEEALLAHRCDDLCFVAANPFLGELRSHLRDLGKKALRTIAPSDLSGLGLPELSKHLIALEL